MKTTASKPPLAKIATRALCIILALCALAWNLGGAFKKTADYAAFAPQNMDARSTALFITGANGWTEEDKTKAQRLSQMHTLVVQINGPHVFAEARGNCVFFADRLAQIARRAQEEHDAFARTPVLVGTGDGVQFAINAAWARPGMFKGLVTEAAPVAISACAQAEPGTQRPEKAPLRWLDIAASNARSPAAQLAGVTVVDPADTPRKAFYQSYLRLAGTDSAFDINSSTDELSDLPLTIHQDQQAKATDSYAIFLSGDGGWANFDEQVADRLAAQGVPVVGISSLRYLWREKSPEQIAQDLQRIDRHFRKKLNRRNVVLLGFSLGANTLPFAVAELPPGFIDRLAGLGLIGPETHTGFEIVVGGWLGQKTGAIEVAPAIRTLADHIPAQKILCLHGDKETVSACPATDLPGMQQVTFKGGHHLGHDHDAVAQTIVTQLSLSQRTETGTP